MNKIRYYFGWFNGNIPQQIAQSILNDTPCKKSLVIVSNTPANNEETDKMAALAKNMWFEPAGVVFDNYHIIDYRMSIVRVQ